MSTRFYEVQIGGTHLTETGADVEPRCKLTVENVEDLLQSVTGTAQTSASGAVVIQRLAWSKGKQFAIRVETLTEEIWNFLRADIDAALAEGLALQVTGEGALGNFSVPAESFPQKPYFAERFSNGYVHGAVFRFITV